MTFFIPPVFLFGNNANRFHNNEKEKSEYKTATETEIKVENWRAKRIAQLEEENKGLENENIRLKSDIDAMLQNERGYKYDINKLEEENKKLKEWAEENSYLKAENKKLEVENRKLRIELSAYDREYFDEDKKAAFIFPDFGGYDEDAAN